MPFDQMRNIIGAVSTILSDGGVDGEVLVPRGPDGSFGRIMVTREIIIIAPTVEKIEAELRRIWGNGFSGNVRCPLRMVDPFVITTEEYRTVGTRHLKG